VAVKAALGDYLLLEAENLEAAIELAFPASERALPSSP
jgi:hypothetical protein